MELVEGALCFGKLSLTDWELVVAQCGTQDGQLCLHVRELNVDEVLVHCCPGAVWLVEVLFNKLKSLGVLGKNLLLCDVSFSFEAVDANVDVHVVVDFIKLMKNLMLHEVLEILWAALIQKQENE